MDFSPPWLRILQGMCAIALFACPVNASNPQELEVKWSDFPSDFVLVEPLVYGAYPRSMRQLVKTRLPNFTEKEMMMVKRSFDFIGINYYTSRYGKNETASPGKPISYRNDQLALSWTKNVDGIQIGPLLRKIG
ncbi:hypothetical protein ACE6H2_017803 [Prunus campanulata]